MPDSKKTCMANKPLISLSFSRKGSRLNLYMSGKKATKQTKTIKDEKIQAVLRTVRTQIQGYKINWNCVLCYLRKMVKYTTGCLRRE